MLRSVKCAEPVQLWSAEIPHVYCLVIKVVDSESCREGIEASQVAFRHSSVTGGFLLHNGRPIMVRGVNRHEHDPLVGKVGQFDFI
jgi:beta-galactosidase